MIQTDSHLSKEVHPALNQIAWLKRGRIRWSMILVCVIALLLAAQHWAPEPSFIPGGSPLLVLIIFLAAYGCELMDSSLGMGYGTTLTPLLMLLGFAPLEIVPAVLFSELLTGMLSAYMHQRDGNVDFLSDVQARKTALFLVSLSCLGGGLAVWLAISLSPFWLSLFVTLIILAMGVVIVLTRSRRIPYRRNGIMVVGAIAAFNKSLSGGGYGPLVTAGQVVSGMPAKNAVVR